MQILTTHDVKHIRDAGGMDLGFSRAFQTCQTHNFQTVHISITFSDKRLGLNGCHHGSALCAYQMLMKVSFGSAFREWLSINTGLY